MSSLSVNSQVERAIKHRLNFPTLPLFISITHTPLWHSSLQVTFPSCCVICDFVPSSSHTRDAAHFTVWWADAEPDNTDIQILSWSKNPTVRSTSKPDPLLYDCVNRIYQTWISLVKDDRPSVNVRNEQEGKSACSAMLGKMTKRER